MAPYANELSCKCGRDAGEGRELEIVGTPCLYVESSEDIRGDVPLLRMTGKFPSWGRDSASFLEPCRKRGRLDTLEGWCRSS